MSILSKNTYFLSFENSLGVFSIFKSTACIKDRILHNEEYYVSIKYIVRVM